MIAYLYKKTITEIDRQSITINYKLSLYIGISILDAMLSKSVSFWFGTGNDKVEGLAFNMLIMNVLHNGRVW